MCPIARQAAVTGLTGLLADRLLSHTIGARFGLDDISSAHEAVESGATIGNVVVELS